MKRSLMFCIAALGALSLNAASLMPAKDKISIGGADGSAACSIGIIGGSDGPTALIVAHAKGPAACEGLQHYTACSALRFAPPERIQWRMAFRETQPDRITIELLPRAEEIGT